MVEHILVAIDGSGPSRHAARFGLSLAAQVKAKVTLLTVLEPPSVIPLGPLSTSIVTQPISEKDIASIRSRLDAIAAESPGVQTQGLVEIGPVAETILDWASHHDVDMIVLGEHGHGAARRFLLGSVSDRVVHHAHCPVTIWR
jgi:nucleotide-binding universal stress UspA family protein